MGVWWRVPGGGGSVVAFWFVTEESRVEIFVLVVHFIMHCHDI